MKDPAAQCVLGALRLGPMGVAAGASGRPARAVTGTLRSASPLGVVGSRDGAPVEPPPASTCGVRVLGEGPGTPGIVLAAMVLMASRRGCCWGLVPLAAPPRLSPPIPLRHCRARDSARVTAPRLGRG